MSDKEIYYKIFNHRNQLMLVTPLLSNARELLSECLGREITSYDFNVCKTQRFYDGYRVLRVEL